MSAPATTPIVERVDDRWPDAPDVPEGLLDQLVLASNLLGADRGVANFGGGNTSAKGTAADHTGRPTRVMWVKGSGSDLATMGSSDFTGLRLGEVEPLIDRGEMSDEDMVAYLGRCALDPRMPRSSIETLLHAFIPAGHVHHTHPDGINVIAGTADGAALTEECFGEEAAWVAYIRPGFTLAKQIGEIVRANPQLKLVVMAKHGLVVWGDSAEEAYRRTIAVINQAVDFVAARTAGQRRFGGPAPGGDVLDQGHRRDLLAALMPIVRGAVSSGRPKILTADTGERTVEFVSSLHAGALVSVGAACPDHLVHTRRVPAWVPFDPSSEGVNELVDRVRSTIARYRADYREYLVRYSNGATLPGDADPRVVLVQHLGLIGAGTTPRASALSRDLYHRAIEVMAGAEALGEFVSLTPAESFAVEYWPLELYKLSLAPPARELQGRVALVTGAAGGIGRAIVSRLGAEDASVVGLDLDLEGAREALAPLGSSGLAVSGDVTDERSVGAAFAAAIERFGGIDIVISNAGIASSAPVEQTSLREWDRNQRILATGYFLVAREAFKLFRAQGIGGSLIFVASKNALVGGKDAAAYSSAKAAELHLARCLAEEGGPAGIRVNTVNPDAVLSGSRIWGPGSTWRQQRAAAYGIDPDELEEYYRQRNALKVSVLPEDVAEAVLHFASPARSGKSTGNILNVDGGVAAAFPR
jgi:rhamnulose-1-phosphate aldolase/alcohol dehydrogenase